LLDDLTNKFILDDPLDNPLDGLLENLFFNHCEKKSQTPFKPLSLSQLHLHVWPMSSCWKKSNKF